MENENMLKDSGWKYFLPEDGERREDSSPIKIYEWQNVYDAEDAAVYASEDEWSNRDGWERDVGVGPTITVVAPNGSETKFETYREATVEHTVSPINEGKSQ